MKAHGFIADIRVLIIHILVFGENIFIDFRFFDDMNYAVYFQNSVIDS